MKSIKLFAVLAMIFGMMSFNQTKAQTTTWIFDAGDGKGGAIKVVENAHAITGLYLWDVSGGKWNSTVIQSIDDQGDYTYARIKSNVTNRTYEVYVYWYDDKMYFSLPEGDEKTYWLRK